MIHREAGSAGRGGPGRRAEALKEEASQGGRSCGEGRFRVEGPPHTLARVQVQHAARAVERHLHRAPQAGPHAAVAHVHALEPAIF